MADAFRKWKSLYSATANSFGTGEGVTITPSSVSGLPTDTEITLTFDRQIEGKLERIKGTVVGGNFVVSSGGRGYDGTTEQSHTSPTIEHVVNAADINDMVDGILEEHNQDGTHDIPGMVTEDGTQTLENKTLTSPTINTPIIQGWDGWTPDTDTWVYASATTFTIAGKDVTAQFPKGTKIKLTQTSAKYFYVVGSAFSTNTTIAVTGGTDYTLADAAITTPFYSYMDCPQGHPIWFDYTPTYGGSGSLTFSSVATVVGRFMMSGSSCTTQVYATGTTGGTTNTTITFTTPINNAETIFIGYGAGITDGSATTAGVAFFGAANAVSVRKYDASGWSLGAARAIGATITYKTA
jgi:hypothetical protein